MMTRAIDRAWWGLAAASLLLAPVTASAWWNGDWGARKQFRIDTSAAGANVTEAIGTAPVLVRLHSGNFRFDAAKEDGSDLRFVAGDDRTPLKHHVERYDGLLGEALVWVAIPDLKPGARTEVWLYYKNPKATAADDAKGTYDAATALVYHFDERGQPPRDASAAGNHGLGAGTPAEGAIIGRGLSLGASPVTVPAGPSLAWSAGARVTWSAWVKPAEADGSGVVFSRRGSAGAFVVGMDGGKPFVEVDPGSGPRRATAPAALPAGKWRHLAVTTGEETVLYLDGSPAARMAAALPALDGPSLIGPAAAEAGARAPATRGKLPPAPAVAFKGDIDELQLARADRPPGFLQVAAISQGTDPGKLLVAGPDEESGGFGSGHMAVIVRSVTLDGWVVIGLLMVMAVVSWLVMASKASYLGAAERADGRFIERFRKRADLVRLINEAEGGSPLGDEKDLRDAPLYRQFTIAAEEIRKRTDGTRPLSAEAIESIRASLDAGLVRENQKLSRLMVLLTIAISGGPFLGLLGTVVGVMITFASIAAAGDVNVNAIAPGIAAALVATVAGLAVAIPALFGYNWLLTRIKDVTATLQVFVDEFVTKLAEAYALNGAREGHPTRALAARE
jgi:biopolymer transport protein ExbB